MQYKDYKNILDHPFWLISKKEQFKFGFLFSSWIIKDVAIKSQNFKVHFFLRNRASSISPVLLHQPFCIKVKRSMKIFPVCDDSGVLCHFHSILLFSIFFMFWGLIDFDLYLIVVTGFWIPGIPWTVLKLFWCLKCKRKTFSWILNLWQNLACTDPGKKLSLPAVWN